MEKALPVKWYSYDIVYTLTRLGSRAIEGDARCFHVAPRDGLSLFARRLYRSLRQLRKENPGRYPGSQLIFCYTKLGLMVGIGAEKKGSNRWGATRYAFRIDLPGSTPTYDDICRVAPSITSRQKRARKRKCRDREQESAGDAGLYHARDAAGNYAGADLPSSSFDASNFEIRHNGAYDSSWDFARSLVDSSGFAPVEGRADENHHHVIETGGPITSADVPILHPEFEDQWPGAEVRSKLERASTYEEWVEALLGAPDPEQPERRTGEHHHSERGSSSASVDDLQFPFEFDDLWPDPEARSNDEWVEAIFDSAGSVQSAAHTAEHHHEIDGGSTTEDEEDLSLPFELEDLWPEAEDRSSEAQLIRAFLAFPEASNPPPPAVLPTGELEENSSSRS